MTYTLKQKLSAVTVLVTRKVSYRDAAKAVGIPAYVVYYFIYEDLKIINYALYLKVRLQMIENAERWKGEQAYDLRPLD